MRTRSRLPGELVAGYCGPLVWEIWSARSIGQLPLSEEERLRGGDHRIEACLLVEALRVQEAERIADAFVQLPAAAIGVYRLLCEIKAKPG